MQVARAIALCGFAVTVGCAAPTIEEPTTTAPSDQSAAGKLSVEANSTTRFVARFERDADWARIDIVYTPGTTLYELTTSFGSAPIVLTGTAPGDPTGLDPRAKDGWVLLAKSASERPLIAAFHAALLNLGAKEHPSSREQGSTLYAAAYWTARTLDLVPAGQREVWPYPGFEVRDEVPLELRTTGDQSAVSTCCGPISCACSSWDPSGCGWNCKAGDTCNYYNLGNCGSICPWGQCPHNNGYHVNGQHGSPYGFCQYHWT